MDDRRHTMDEIRRRSSHELRKVAKNRWAFPTSRRTELAVCGGFRRLRSARVHVESATLGH